MILSGSVEDFLEVDCYLFISANIDSKRSTMLDSKISKKRRNQHLNKGPNVVL